MPPLKPPGSTATPAEEAERLGREHSNKREFKMRQERARLTEEGKTPPPRPRLTAAGTGVPGLVGAPVVQPRKPENRPAEVDERLGRPLPERPTERKVVPPADADPSVIDDVAVEAEELMREGGAVWARFTVADKITFVCALLTGFGTLLPWLYRKDEELVLGLGCGGIVHAFISVTAIALLIRRELPDDRGSNANQRRRRARRTALLLLLLALVSTVAGTWFLLVYGAVRRFAVSDLEVSVGLYVTLAAGLGLSYSGFAFFWRGGERND